MRRTAFAITIFALTCTVSARQPEPKPKTDLEIIQGSWWIVGLENGGKALPEKSFRGNTFTFSKLKGANSAVLHEAKYSPIEFTFSLDPAKKPKALDLTIRGNTARGIYKVEGDDLTICMSLVGPRPTDFATTTGGDTETFILKRNLWERYTDKTFGFSIEFPPGKPAETKREVETHAGKTTVTSLTIRSEMDRLTFTVSVTPLLEKVEPKDSERVFDSAQQVILGEIDANAVAKLESEGKPFKAPNGAAGVMATREFTVGLSQADSKDRAAMRVRLLIAGNHLYSLVVTGSEGATKSFSVGQFWNSLRISSAKKKDMPGRP